MAANGLPQGNIFMQQAGLGNMARLEQVGSTNLPLSVGGTPSGNARSTAANLRNTIDKLLGGTIQLNETRSVDLDATYQSAPHAAMGLTVGVSGRATIVNADVASHLAEFQDPIKSLLGVGIHRDTRVIIKRRFVQGGDAQVIPERAPGRTVSVRTEEREVVLARYGCDIEMSTNLMAGEPELAAADLKIKLDFQKRQLDRKLVDLGYEAIMKTATESPRAVLESMPGRSNMNAAAAAIELENIRARVFFGAFEKYEQPLQNLLAAAKRGSLPNADPYDTMIVPAGLPDLHQFARQEARHYYLNGTPETELDGVKFQLGGGLYDAPSGVTCYVTYPKADYASGGTLRPRMSENALYRKRTIAMWYRLNGVGANQVGNAQRMDFDTGEWVDVQSDSEIVLLTVMMSSAIVGKGGSDTGELLVAYPMTSVHTVETSPEYMKMQLRTHLGAAVYRPENLQVLPDIHFEGFVSQESVRAGAVNNMENPIKVFAGAGNNAPGCQQSGALVTAAGAALPANVDLPGMAYRGAMRYQNNAGEWTYVSNGGHLGPVDCPEGMSKIRGHNVFSRQPVSVMSKSC